MEPAQESSVAPVLIVSPDERWLRVLEITVRLGGHRPVTRRSINDALRVREGEEPPLAIVFDLGDQWTTEEIEAVRALLSKSTVPAVVVLPERLTALRARAESIGATVLVRPYRPSELYAVLPPPPAPSAAPARARRRRVASTPAGADEGG